MPELPEVTTTVNGMNKFLKNLTIKNVWSDYFINTKDKRENTIKNKKYFEKFKKEVTNKKIIGIERRGKNILIHLSNEKTILCHMKMTGHFLYGKYEIEENVWTSKDKKLNDPFNRFVHLVFSLSNGKHLAFSDMRKFAKLLIFETKKSLPDISNLGPEPLEIISAQKFLERLKLRPKDKIKSVLMNQEIIAGIGNIYSDEILWEADLHPEKIVSKININDAKKILSCMKKILKKSIKMGGDSMSDYRNILGEKGGFQNFHKVYKKTGQKCQKNNCGGIIERKIIGGRSSHFCNKHQK